MSKSKNVLRTFFFELVIIFIGVYGAFELNRYQENKRQHKIQLNYLSSFRSELGSIRAAVGQTKAQVDGLIKRMEEGIAAGEEPTLVLPNLYFLKALLITQIGLSDDVFVQLDPGLAVSLSGGYDMVQTTSLRIKDFNNLCSNKLVSDSPLQFYDRQSQLRPEYNWYMEGLRDIQQRLTIILQVIDEGAMPGTDQLLNALD